MINFTTTNEQTVDSSTHKPKSTTLDLIRQYARVCTPITAIAFSQLIAN